MVITVTCPSCSSSFPVDPAKVPEGGVNARCSSCGDIFRVEKPVDVEPLPTLEDLGPTPEPLPDPTPEPLPEPDEAASVSMPEPWPEGDSVEGEPATDMPSDDWVFETEEAPSVQAEPLPSVEPLPEIAAPDAAGALDPPPELEPSEPEPAQHESGPAEPESGPAEPEPGPAEPGPGPAEPGPDGDPFAQPAPFERAAPVAEPTAAPVEPTSSAPASDPVEQRGTEQREGGQDGAGVQGFTFGKRDPTDKAKRLARVLVSDMIMYNAERHQSALSSGTLEQDFEEEIAKSWKEYVEQVGDELANGPGRDFWRDALNDILAKGQRVF